MSRIEQHSAVSFLIYYIIWLLWKKTWIIGGEYRFIVFLIVFFGLFPDLDTIIFGIKYKKNARILSDQFQHHYTSPMHWPLLYTPFIVLFILSLIFNFYPEYFLVPVIGIYLGHFLMDTIACGDGIMWGKIPWKKKRYARFISVWAYKTDGYHGLYWDARYRQTKINKIGDIAIIISFIIILFFQLDSSIYHFQIKNPPGISGYYVAPLIYFILAGLARKNHRDPKYLKEPSNGRYNDYRIDPTYINGLNEKNHQKHLIKYSHLL
ncbi:MAG: hypothetical protein ACTSR8_04330 [Promethearchaeota archaeon]